jgi:hypothetical protein
MMVLKHKTRLQKRHKVQDMVTTTDDGTSITQQHHIIVKQFVFFAVRLR